MTLSIKVGNNREGISDGITDTVRGGRTGEMMVGLTHDELTEECLRGNLFYSSSGGGGVAPGTSLTTSPPFALWNPPGSGVAAVIIEVSVAYLSGTLGAGSIVSGTLTNQNQSPTGGFGGNSFNTLIGSLNKPNCGTFISSTFSALPTLMENLWNVGAFTPPATLFLPTLER